MTRTTDEVIDRFNRAFHERDATLLEDIIAPECVMESVQPAPDGTREEGYEASFSSWEALIADTTSHFEVEGTSTPAKSGRSSVGATSGAKVPATRSVASTSCGSSTARSSRLPATRRPLRSPPWRVDSVI